MAEDAEKNQIPRVCAGVPLPSQYYTHLIYSGIYSCYVLYEQLNIIEKLSLQCLKMITHVVIYYNC